MDIKVENNHSSFPTCKLKKKNSSLAEVSKKPHHRCQGLEYGIKELVSQRTPG